MAQIPLENGGAATVDNVGFAALSEYLWWKCEQCGHIYRLVDTGDAEPFAWIEYMASMVMGIRAPVHGACNPCLWPKDISSRWEGKS